MTQTEMQCTVYHVPFRFHQTGSILIRGNKVYHIPRFEQEEQAHKAGIDYTPEGFRVVQNIPVEE